MLNVRFLVSWILGALIMYSAFYLWHGVLSTDFYRINYPKGLFLSVAALVYLVISAVLYKLFEVKFWKKITANLFLRGIICGAVLGVTLFAFSLVIGVRFSGAYSMKILALDLFWQILEQVLGGTIIALGHFFIFVPELEEEEIGRN